MYNMSRAEQKMPVLDKVTDIDYFMPSLHRTFKYSVLTFFFFSFYIDNEKCIRYKQGIYIRL